MYYCIPINSFDRNPTDAIVNEENALHHLVFVFFSFGKTQDMSYTLFSAFRHYNYTESKEIKINKY